MDNLEWSKKRRKLVCGWGINDAEYVTKSLGHKTCPYYTKWQGMLRRAFGLKYKEKNSTYLTVTVYQNWKYFSNFKAWMETQNWQGLELAKDLLIPGNKIYSPDACVFIPSRLNKSINTKVSLDKRDCPLGVYRIGSKFRANLSCEDKVRIYLGNHSTKEAAHKAWQWAKAEQLEKLVVWYAAQDCFRSDVAESLTSKVWRLRLDHSTDTETVRGWI